MADLTREELLTRVEQLCNWHKYEEAAADKKHDREHHRASVGVLESVLRALSAPPSATGAMVVTDEMWQAAMDAGADLHEDVAAIFLAMLAAAPAAPVQFGKEPRGCPTPGACSCPPAEPVQEAVASDEVLFAIKRPEGYEDVHPDLLAHDMLKDCAEYRIVTPPVEAGAITVIGEMVDIPDGLGTVIVEWNDDRYNLPPGAKVYALSSDMKQEPGQ